MEETKNGALSVENTTEMVEQLRKSFDEMESHRECLSHEKSLLEDIKQHFNNIKKSLQQKFDEIETKERAFEEKKAEYHALLAARDASVNAKEQDLFDHLQELKDVAVSAIAEAHKKYKASLENKVSTSAYDDPNASTSAPGENNSFNKSSSAVDTPFKVKLRLQVKQLCEQMNSKGLVKCISDNRKTLATMHDVLTDALRGAKEPAHLVLNAIEAFYPPNQFDSSRQSKDNNLQYLQRTCFQILESASPLLGMAEPGSDNLLSSEFKQRAKIIADKWKAKLAIMNLDASNGYSLEALSFLQLLVTFSISSEFDEDELCKLVISVSRHRNQAPELCRVLGLAHKTQDVVRALVNKGRQIDAALFSHAFQLTEIFPLVPLLKQYLEDMKKNFAQIEASGTELHSTNSYRSNYYTPFQRDTANQELGALKAVIKCIEEYKLHEEYPPDPLHQRVAEIEKAKADKKRAADAAPVQAMKPWADGGYAPPKVPVDVDIRLKPSTVYDERVRYYGSGGANRHLYAAPPAYAASGRSGDNRYPYTAPPAYEASGHSGDNSYPYYAAPPAFEVSGHAPYGLQSSASRPYHYQDDRLPPSHVSNYRAPHGSLPNHGSYASPPVQSTPGNYVNYTNSGMQQPASSNHGNYTISSLQSSHQSYM